MIPEGFLDKLCIYDNFDQVYNKPNNLPKIGLNR